VYVVALTGKGFFAGNLVSDLILLRLPAWGGSFNSGRRGCFTRYLYLCG